MEKKNLFFWQNSLSPHQLPYIKECCNDSRIGKVYYIVPEIISSKRQNLWWDNTGGRMGDVNVIINPDIAEVNKLLSFEEVNSYHFFSGIRANPMVFKCFKLSLNYNIKRGIITEAPFTYMKPLFLHKLRFFLFDYKYVRHIHFIYGFGENAVKYYNWISKKWNVFLHSYCVEFNINNPNNLKTENFRFVYVGNLTDRKNVLLLLHVINKLKSINISLDIIGDGVQKNILQEYINKNSLQEKISLLGKKGINDIQNILIQYDSLILPSKHDGWGAVVNEALYAGLFVVCSDNCGSKALIQESERGTIFRSNNEESLKNALKMAFSKQDKIRNNQNETQKWSMKIQGKSLAKYFIDCLQGNDQLPPWKN